MLEESTTKTTGDLPDHPATTRGQICPVCGMPPTKTTERREGSIVTLYLLCPSGHMWEAKWLSQLVAPDDPCTKCRAFAPPIFATRTGDGDDLEVRADYECQHCGYGWFSTWTVEECLQW